MNYFVINKINIKKNINNFVVFENENHNGDKICGLMADNNHIYVALGNCKFDNVPKLIPQTHKQIKRNKNYCSDEWVIDVFFKKYTSPEKIEKLKEIGCDYEEWYEKSRKYWLKLKTILDMNNGDEIKCLLLDRNVLDTIHTDNKIGKLYVPKYFFRNCTAIIKKIKDLTVKIVFSWEKQIDESRNFEFDVEYKKDNWYPLKNGVLPDEYLQMSYEILGKKNKWNELPNNIHIGYRGPMILWNNIYKMPGIYIL